MTITAMFNGKPVRSGKDVWPLVKVDHLYILSASILERSFKLEANQIPTFNALCEQLDLPPPTVYTTWANGGDNSEDYVAELPALLADAEGKSNVLVLIHGFGNDISRDGPWPGGSEQYDSYLRSIIDDIHAAGHKALVSSASYRVRGFSHPSAPYNMNINYPVIKEKTPQFWRNEKPVFDLYSHTINNQELITTDGVHPTLGGQLAIRGVVAKALADIALPKPRLPAAADFSGKRIVVCMHGGISSYTQGVSAGISSEGPSATSGALSYVMAYNLVTADGTKMYGVNLDQRFHTTVNTDGRRAAGDNSASLTNANVIAASTYTSSRSGPILKITGLPNGLTGTVSVTGARNTTATDRVGEFTYRGETLQLNGAANPPEISSWPMIVEDGTVTIEWGCAEGSTYAYLSGIQLDFDEIV